MPVVEVDGPTLLARVSVLRTLNRRHARKMDRREEKRDQ